MARRQHVLGAMAATPEPLRRRTGVLRYIGNLLIFLVILILVVGGIGLFLLFGPYDAPRRMVAGAVLSSLLGRSVEFRGTLDIEPGEFTRVTLSDARMDDASWGEADYFMRIGKGDLSISTNALLDGRFVFQSVRIEDSQFELEIDEEGQENWDLSGTPLPTVDQLSLLNSDIHFTQAKTGLKLTARVERLSRNLGPAFGGLVIDAKGELDGEPVEISGKVELEGRELPSEGDVPLQIKAGLGELRLDWTGRAGSDRIAVDGDAMLGKTKLMGKIVLDLGKERPLVSAEIESRLLDFADFEALPWVGGDGKANGKKGKPARNSGKGKATDKGSVIADTSMGFGFLEEADVDLKLKIDKIKGAKRTASGVTGRIMVVDRKLAMEKLSVRLDGGRITLTGTVDTESKPSQIHLKGSADDWHLGTIWKSMGASVPVSGELYATFDLKGRGETAQQVARTLDGRASLAISRGRIKSSLLALTGLDISSWLVSRSAAQGYSDLNCFIGRFSVKQGVARSQALLLDTTDVLFEGRGTVNLRNETVNIEVKPTPKRRKLIELVTPFTVKGSLGNPSVVAHGAVVRTAAEYYLAPINALGALVGLIVDDGADTKNPCIRSRKGTRRRRK